MKVFHGTATYHGIAIGKIRYLRRNEQHIRQYTVESARREVRRFQQAKVQALEELKSLYARASEELGESESKIFKSQIALLENGSFTRAIESQILSEKVNAAYAVVTTRDEITQNFARLEDEVVRNRVMDIRDISERLVLIIEGISKDDYSGTEPFIVVANQLSPTEILEMDQGKILAFVTELGSPVSHTSIIAKTMSIPALISVSVDPLWEDRQAVVDGYEGKIYIDPDEETLEKYRKRRQEEDREKEFLQKLSNMEDVTLDGTHVRLYANIANLEDITAVLRSGATGIGLLRSEFQYLGRENYPRETELFRAYKKVAMTMGERLVVIRTLDIGADKKAEYMDLPDEENPAMGNRGIRVCLRRKRMFKAQLRAIYRASAFGNLAIMYPMITSMDEVREIKEIVAEVVDGLKKKEIPFKNIQHGIMVETPAAVMIAEDLAAEVDFLSVGTNDLTQYILAMDRKNPSLKDSYDDRHPAVLKMIRMTIEAAHKEGCWVSICGELAGDTSLTKMFLEMGVDVLSVVPPSILTVRKQIRETSI